MVGRFGENRNHSRKPMWMAGYGGCTAPADGTETDLVGKALLLDGGNGNAGVIISLGIMGIDRAFAQDLCKLLKQKHGLEREQIDCWEFAFSTPPSHHREWHQVEGGATP